MEKKLIFGLVLLLLLIGCKGKGEAKKFIEDIRAGTEGIAVGFLPNNPPDTIHAEESAENPVKVVLQLNNKGAFPQPDEGTTPGGKIYLSGYDKNIISFDKDAIEISQRALEGKSTINPNGGIDFVTFEGKVLAGNLNVDKYEPTILATACYYYSTEAGPQVCIDPDPYSTILQKKVCEVHDTALSSQGAPIAVTSIAEEALATKTQFRITIKNVGGGSAIKLFSDEKCNPYGEAKLGREDIDKVYLQEAKIGVKTLECSPFAEGAIKNKEGDIRLVNGEGSIICELQKGDYAATNEAYTTPLRIKLIYNYKITAEKKILIKKEPSGLGESTPVSSRTEPAPSAQDTSIPPLTKESQNANEY